LAALDQIERAAESDSISTVIAFNRALLLERLHLFDAATRAWTTLLATDLRSGWRREVAGHVKPLEKADRRPQAGAETTDWIDATRDNPEAARTWALNEAVGEWARRTRSGDTRGAGVLAQKVRDIGETLAEQFNDSSIAHVAHVFGDTRDSTLEAVLQFDDGSRDRIRGEFARAKRELKEASERLHLAGHHALGDWTDVLVAGVSTMGSKFATVESLATAVGSNAYARGDVALLAWSLWVRALAEAREGKATQSADRYAAAARLFRQIGDSGYTGSMLSQKGDVLFLLGQDDPALELKVEAFALLQAAHDPMLRSGPLLGLGRQLDEIGEDYAGRAVLREAVLSGHKSERSADLPEALLRLGAAEFAAGMVPTGQAHLDSGRVTIPDDPVMRDRLLMELASAEAVASTTTDPKTALERLDAVADFFRRRGILYDFATPLARAASLRLHLGQSKQAKGNLAEAVAALDSLSAKSSISPVVVASARQEFYRELVDVHVANRDTLEAFRSWAKARGQAGDHLPVVAHGRTVLAYTVLPERTILWILRAGSLHMREVRITATQLESLVAGLERATRTSALADSLKDLTRQLYDLLVAPAERQVAGATDLRIVPDGIVGRIPFSELRRDDGKYLIEVVPLSYGSTIGDADRTAAETRRVAIVGGGAFDRTLFPGLEALPAASREIERIQEIYGERAIPLDGAGATKSAFLAVAPSVGVVHFAGHARLVERAPRLSHLVFAQQPGGLATNALTAAEIERINWHRVGLVVLSACGTTQVRGRRDNSENGLANSFLKAGAGAVVSNLWDAEDESTAKIMGMLHQRLNRGARPEVALQQAQLAMIKSSSDLSPPRVWSGFRIDR
jgi:CHAT domain-containing protein